MDRWAKDKCPTCTNCGVSHYEDTELAVANTKKAKYRVVDNILTKDTDSDWLPYYVLQNLSEHIYTIDQKLAHDVGLSLRGRLIDKIAWSLVLRNLIVSSKRKRKRELYVLDAGYDVESPEDLELNAVLKTYICWLSKKWTEESAKRKYNPTLKEAARLRWPGSNAAEDEKALYKAVKEQLRRFRKSIEIE